MAGTITVGELLSDATSSNKILIGSGTTLDLKASAGTTTMPAGSVLQVVTATYDTQLETTPSSFTDSGLTATITPSSTSSKILILAHNSTFVVSANYAYCGIQRNISGGSSTFLGHSSYGLTVSLDNNGNGASPHSINYLDSPSTISAITYDFQYKCSATAKIQMSSTKASITLMEIAG